MGGWGGVPGGGVLKCKNPAAQSMAHFGCQLKLKRVRDPFCLNGLKCSWMPLGSQR